ncbi:MAG TPA: Ig-like domain-containing protein [Pyrinomonadaceae bacterium]
MVGTGIEKYSAEAAASINRQAEATQYNAGYQADVIRSGGQLEAGNMRASGQRASQMASIQAALTSQTAATLGAATTQRMIGPGSFTSPNQYSFSWSNVGVGGYSVTARATDNRGAVTNSNSAYVTVNSPPTPSITGPANGSTFVAPASVTINANASDTDGFITKVEFFKNSVKIGEDLNPPYTFTWSNVAAGSYGLTTVATDNVGATGTSSPINITVMPSALFVTGSTTLNTSETAIKTRLQNMGYSVTVKDAKSSVSGDATGRKVVVISSTVAPNNLSTKFRTVAVPVVIWESLSFADMGMTPTGNSNAGTTTAQTHVKIILPAHVLAGGLSGTQTVSTSSIFSWGKPNANASSVATLENDSTKIIIFGYNTGALMPGLVAPARRVGLFMSDTTAEGLDGNGWTLFDAAINWATAP